MVALVAFIMRQWVMPQLPVTDLGWEPTTLVPMRAATPVLRVMAGGGPFDPSPSLLG